MHGHGQGATQECNLQRSEHIAFEMCSLRTSTSRYKTSIIHTEHRHAHCRNRSNRYMSIGEEGANDVMEELPNGSFPCTQRSRWQHFDSRLKKRETSQTQQMEVAMNSAKPGLDSLSEPSQHAFDRAISTAHIHNVRRHHKSWMSS